MIVTRLLALDQPITGTGTVHTSPELYGPMALAEKSFVSVRVSLAGGLLPTMTIVLERSNDGLAWTAKSTLFNGQALDTTADAVYYAEDSGTSVGGCYARLAITLGSTGGTPSGYFRIHITGRARTRRSRPVGQPAVACVGCSSCTGSSFAMGSSAPMAFAGSEFIVPPRFRVPGIPQPPEILGGCFQRRTPARPERLAACVQDRTLCTSTDCPTGTCPPGENCYEVQVTTNTMMDPVTWSRSRFMCSSIPPTEAEIWRYVTGVDGVPPAPAGTRIVRVTRYVPAMPATSTLECAPEQFRRPEVPPFPRFIGPGPMPPRPF